MNREIPWLLVAVALLLLINATADLCEANRREMQSLRDELRIIKKVLDYDGKASLFNNQLKRIEAEKKK